MSNTLPVCPKCDEASVWAGKCLTCGEVYGWVDLDCVGWEGGKASLPTLKQDAKLPLPAQKAGRSSTKRTYKEK